MKTRAIAKRSSSKLNYSRIADGLSYLSAVILFSTIFGAFFVPEIMPQSIKEQSDGSDLLATHDKIKLFNPFFVQLNYGVMMLSSFSALLFFSLWQHFYLNFSKKDFAIFWFASAMLSWAIAGYAKNAEALWLMILMSQVNNLCFLLSLPHFKYGFRDKILPILVRIGITEQNYPKRVLLLILLLFPTYLPMFNNIDSLKVQGKLERFVQLLYWVNIGSFVNLLMSCALIIMLGIVLWVSFKRRRFEVIKWLSLLTMFFLLMGEIVNFIKPYMQGKELGKTPLTLDEIQIRVITDFLLAMGKVMLMVLVAGLAMSWLYENILVQKKETTHLVKNSLHHFLLDVELQNYADDKTQKIVSRVRALRELVEKIYLDEAGTRIPLRAYLNDILYGLEEVMDFKPYGNFDGIGDMISHGDPARNLGKLVTELILNAFKHGNGVVQVSAEIDGNTLKILIADRGDSHFDFKEKAESEGLGLKLFEIYMETLGGQFRVTPVRDDRGKTLTLTFSTSTFTQ